MWIYPAYRWPDEAAGRSAIAAQGWAEGAPPEVSLLVIGTWHLRQDAVLEGEETPAPVALPGWWLAGAFRDRAAPDAWSAARAVLLEGMPRLGADDLLADYQAAIDGLVQATSRARGYNDAASCAGYVASTVPSWAGEARAFIDWRDQVYLESFETLAAVQGGTMAPPTVEAFVASLPAIVWPA